MKSRMGHNDIDTSSNFTNFNQAYSNMFGSATNNPSNPVLDSSRLGGIGNLNSQSGTNSAMNKEAGTLNSKDMAGGKKQNGGDSSDANLKVKKLHSSPD